MKSNSFTLLAFFCFSLSSLHSKAIWVFSPDYFVENGKSYMIQNCPIEVIFDSIPELRPRADEYWLETNKNYQATFSVQNSMLVINAITVRRYGNDSVIVPFNALSEVFRGEGPIVLDWFSGQLIIEMDYHTSRTDMKYKVMEVVKGHVTKVRVLNYDALNRLRRRVYKANAQKIEFFKLDDLKGEMFYAGRLRWRRHIPSKSYQIWDYASLNDFDLIRKAIKSIWIVSRLGSNVGFQYVSPAIAPITVARWRNPLLVLRYVGRAPISFHQWAHELHPFLPQQW